MYMILSEKDKDEELIQGSKRFIYSLAKIKELYNIFLVNKDFNPIKEPLTFFMAGSPGAGKTEYSRNFIKEIKENILRIDADEIRAICPGYCGFNAHLFQEASTIGVNKLYDFSLKKKINVLIDGTFSNYDYSEKNIKRAIDKGRKIEIFYIFQDPKLAWSFTQKREGVEKRRISLDVFARDFILAKDNVQKIKKKFNKKVGLTLIKKDYYNRDEKIWFNVSSVDEYIKFNYNKKTILDLLSINN